MHVDERVEVYPDISQRPCLEQQALGQDTAEPRSPSFRSKIQALHFADALGEPADRAASYRTIRAAREHQASPGRRVHGCELIQLGVEPLEAKIDLELRGVFLEQHACHGEIPWCRRFGQIEIAPLA